jgi:hypothetical protein
LIVVATNSSAQIVHRYDDGRSVTGLSAAVNASLARV